MLNNSKTRAVSISYVDGNKSYKSRKMKKMEKEKMLVSKEACLDDATNFSLDHKKVKSVQLILKS